MTTQGYHDRPDAIIARRTPHDAGVVGLAATIAGLSTPALYAMAADLEHLPGPLYELALPRLVLVLRELDRRAAAGEASRAA